MNRYLIAAMALAGFSGALSAQGRPAAGRRDSADVRIIVSGASRWTASAAWRLDPIPTLVIGSAGGDAMAQFGRIVGAIRQSDGSVVVADSKNSELRAFSAAGRFVRKIGQRGEGPGDFGALAAIMKAPGDTIVTWDYRTHRLTWFTPDGIVARTLPVQRPAKVTTSDGHAMGSSLAAIGLLDDGTALADYRIGRWNPKPGLYSDSLHIVHVDAAGKITPVNILLEGESYSFETSAGYVLFGDQPYTGKANFAVASHSLLYTDAVRMEVREYDLGGHLVRILRIPRPSRLVTGQEISAFRDRDLTETRTQKFRNEADRQPAIEREKAMLDWLPFPKTIPAFIALKLDPAGNIWAREYGDSTSAERWDVFDKDGRLVGGVEMPAGLDVFEIGTDYVLGRMKDDDDVESVRVYRLVH